MSRKRAKRVIRHSECGKPIEKFDLVIGFDTEFVRGSELDIDPEREGGSYNEVISYQFCVLNPRTGRQASFWYTPDKRGRKNRISLGGAIGRALYFAEQESLIDSRDGVLWPAHSAKDRLRIAAVAHFTRADLCGFRDFKKLKSQFDSPRGTFASTERPCVIEARMPDRRRNRSCSVTLFDTKLLAPAGFGSLAKLGSALDFPKLTLPAVVDERGVARRGIERMDLTLSQFREEFIAYAIRDAEVAVRWFQEVADFGFSWGVRDKIRPTVGSLAVAKIIQGREEVFSPILGRALKENPFNGSLSIGDPIPEVVEIQTLCADAFHGGRNECHRVGIYGGADGPFYDWDEAGAYTTAMAHFRAIDWARVEHTKDLDRLAVLDPLTYAAIDFEFPADTKYPSLPVQTGGYGIIFPLRGSTTTCGPELVVALSQGAQITVRSGVRLNWLDEEGVRPFAAYAQEVNIARAKAKADAGGKKGSPHELLAKEAGNSVFGKLGQGVCNMKSYPERRKMFSSRAGEYLDLEPSRITAPHLAAYTSGLPRALLSEIISRLPDGVMLLSCTTDGFLSSLTPDQIEHVLAGPVAQHFSRLRRLVSADGSNAVLELKHTAAEVISVKTRGNFALALGPHIDGKPSDWICARAGHRLEAPPDHEDPAERKRLENLQWLELYLARFYETKLRGMQFASLKDQWEGNADLVELWREVRANFCFDMKRRPIDETIEADPTHNTIRFDTAPWGDISEFLACRTDFDVWRPSAKDGPSGGCLKRVSDWGLFTAWRADKRRGANASRTPFAQWLIIATAKGEVLPRKGRGRQPNSQGWTFKALAELLTAVGMGGVTARVLENSASRDTLPDAPPTLFESDEIILSRLLEQASTAKLPLCKWKSQMCITPQNPVLSNQLISLGASGALVGSKSIPSKLGRGVIGSEGILLPPKTGAPDGPPGAAVKDREPPAPPPPAPPATSPPPQPQPRGRLEASEPRGLDGSDIRHLAEIRRRLEATHGVTRLQIERAARRVPADLPGGVRARRIAALAAALDARLGCGPRQAMAMIGEIAEAALRGLVA